MFYSKQAQGPVNLESLRRHAPSEEANNSRVKVRLLFVHASFTFMNPSLFSYTILADIWDTALENYLKRFACHMSLSLQNSPWPTLSFSPHHIGTYTRNDCYS